MSNKKGKLPILSGPKVERIIDVASPTRAVIATENPIPKYDEASNQIVSEVLLMDGIQWRGGRDQIPIVDSHDDSTVRNIFGSIQHMKVDHATGELIGIPVFASDVESQTISARMHEGHITDFSITGQPIETLFIQRGQTYTTSRGIVIDGPALIHTKWEPQNASICATGADEQSTVRRFYTDLVRKVKRMDEALLAQLTALGLPDGVTDPNQICTWLMGKLGGDAAEEMDSSADSEVMNSASTPPAVPPISAVPPIENMAAVPPIATTRSVSAVERVKSALEADQKRRTEIQAACTLGKVERAFADELCNGFVSLSDARKRIIERMATTPLGTSVGAEVRVTGSEDDKFYAAARDGMIMRSVRASGSRQPAFVNGEKPSAGHEEFAFSDMLRVAERFVQRSYSNVNINRMTKKDIALVAMEHEPTIRRMRIQREAYHNTGSFSNLMLDATNRTLRDGYMEAVYSSSLWVRQGSPAADLRSLHRIMFSEFPNLEMVPENHLYPDKRLSDMKESYKVEKWGALFSVTWEAVVNDDLDAFSRIAAMQGVAAKRTQNAAAYQVLTANALMSDGKALFATDHASGSNLVTAGAVPSETTLNAGFLAMALQKGVDSTVALNITPSFLIVPRALEATALQLVTSMSPPTVGGSAVGTSGVNNLYGPNGMRKLQVISDAVLDANSSAIWYLAASPSEIDTVEMTFLSGEETPVLENEWDYLRDVWTYKIRQTFGVKAIDWRGLFSNDGVT